MKSILTAFALAAGMCLAFMAYAFVTGVATFTPQLGLLFVGFCIVFAVCITFVRKAA
jgi:hypothetical protein